MDDAISPRSPFLFAAGETEICPGTCVWTEVLLRFEDKGVGRQP